MLVSRKQVAILIAMLSLLPVFASAASFTISSSYTNCSNFSSISASGQTFSGNDFSGPLGEVDETMDSTDAGLTLTMTLQTVSSGMPSGTVLATANTVSTNALSASDVPVPFIFPTPYTIVAGTNYGIEISISSPTTNTHYCWASGSPYVNGAYGQYNGSWTMYSSIGSTMTLLTGGGGGGGGGGASTSTPPANGLGAVFSTQLVFFLIAMSELLLIFVPIIIFIKIWQFWL